MNPGTLVLIVGPSGVGKDTLIALARAALEPDPAFIFVRRVITRDPDAGHEIIEPVSRAEFDRRLAAGAFCLHWFAHDLAYGIPAEIQHSLARGQHVIVNGSRSILAQAVAQFAKVSIVLISAPHDLLTQRLAARGRETAAERARRLTRADQPFDLSLPHLTIVNDAAPADAAQKLVSHLRSLT